MLKSESKIGKVPVNAEKVYFFISDFNNIEKFIPAGKIKNWQCTSDSCSFSVDAIGNLSMQIVEKKPHDLIKVQAATGSSFDFNFWVQLKPLDDNSTAIKLTLHADINPMLQMIVKKPVQEALDLMVERMCSFAY